jgi:5-formyltetrahydrofolate cyclo-ligase
MRQTWRRHYRSLSGLLSRVRRVRASPPGSQAPRAIRRAGQYGTIPCMPDPEPAAKQADLREAKRLLREHILLARDALPAATRERHAAAIIAALRAREDFRRARTVLLSLAFRSEWETRPLLRAALASGKSVAAPRVNTARRMLEAYTISDPERDLGPGFRGIAEPLPHCAALALDTIDWVLVPGVAFDTHGHRLGYGGGYYDRLLPLLRDDAHRVAGAYDLQIVDRVPIAPHDRPLDAILTEARIIAPAR